MCQLFAISTNQPLELTPLLAEFFALGEANPHGWGYADLVSQTPFIVHSLERADTGNDAARFLAGSHCVHQALAHIRYATVGQVELTNCHPFTASDGSGRNWTLAHRGTVFNYPPMNPYFDVQVGTSDSERILLYLVDLINAAAQRKGAALEDDERFAVFSDLVRRISCGNCIILAIYDSDCLYLYSNYQTGLNMFIGQDYALFCSTNLAAAPASVALIDPALANPAAANTMATNPTVTNTPLSPVAAASSMPEWQQLPLCSPLAYKRGRLVFCDEGVGEQYFDKDEDTRYLYQDYAAL